MVWWSHHNAQEKGKNISTFNGISKKDAYSRKKLNETSDSVSDNECASDVLEVNGFGVKYYCLVYLDDVFVFSTTCEKHQIHLALMLTRLRKEELKLHL
ncbi:hypothetical protein T4D_2385 [Trichinella pseudospiralis]|uniref:Uncharacterized protein n=1 Tax=Trichinella pseudospiralis TaxID=6337 RepID=A0A0V1FSX8_TRIPS|nr:hypothetical protein T4D_2385 [Trichinella pseudospiralis]